MAGIYIHIPFCKSRCTYCAFYSTTGLELRQRYVDAVCKEMVIRGEIRGEREDGIETIYLGGGTPSQLTIAQLEQLFQCIDKVYVQHSSRPISPSLEITIEVNPDDVTEEFAERLGTLPVNRVSMGVQTFSDVRLRLLNRRHTAAQTKRAVELLRQAGIGNVSLDLMYGFPDETLCDWQYDIDSVLALQPEHLSAYCLSYEEGTPLFEKMRKGAMRMCDEEVERQMYYMLIDRLASAGYEHYEISNFARPGFRSRHNSNYWTGVPYIGLGAAAHSYDGQRRSWNVSDIHLYMEGMERGERIFEEEQLVGDTRYNDMLTVALRTREGLDLTKLTEQDRIFCMKSGRSFLECGLLKMDGHHLRLTREGLFVSDMVMSELMRV